MLKFYRFVWEKKDLQPADFLSRAGMSQTATMILHIIFVTYFWVDIW